MMAHYQNTERLQALLKKHQSENSPTCTGFSTSSSRRWNLESVPRSQLLNAHRSPLEVKDCWPVYHYTDSEAPLLHSSMVWYSIFFFLLSLLTIKRQAKCWCPAPPAWTSATCPHHRSPSPCQTCGFRRHRGRVNRIIEAVKQLQSTSKADAQRPTGLSRGHKRPALRLLAGWSYSGKPPYRANIALCNYRKTAKE